MSTSCYLCVSKQSPRPKTSLHKFPKNGTTRKAWFGALGLSEEVDDVSHTKICSLHFKRDDYVEPNAKLLGGRMVLKREAVLTVSVPNPPPAVIEDFIEASPACVRGDIPLLATLAATTTTEVEMATTEPVGEMLTDILVCSEKQQSADSVQIIHTPKKKKFAEPRFISEITTPDMATPKKARRVLSLVRRCDVEKNKKIKKLQDRNRYLLKRIVSLKDLIKNLHIQGLITEEAGNTLMEVLPTSMREIVSRKIKKKGQYSPEIRSFALTLHFYSPKAYNYVRKHWEKLLPHPSTVRQWYRVVDGAPGFTKEALDAMALRAIAKEIIVNLVIDEMSIKEATVYQNNEFHGGVDFGTVDTKQDNDNVPKANSALVFMAVSLNERWKIPIGYFLNRGLNESERANMLTQAF